MSPWRMHASRQGALTRTHRLIRYPAGTLGTRREGLLSADARSNQETSVGRHSDQFQGGLRSAIPTRTL